MNDKSRLIAVNKFPLIQKVIEPKVIFDLLKKISQGVTNFDFAWFEFNTCPVPGESFIEQRIDNRPFVDGYIWPKLLDIRNEVLKFPEDSQYEIIITRIGAGASPNNPSIVINRIEYRLDPNPKNIYFIHYLAVNNPFRESKAKSIRLSDANQTKTKHQSFSRKSESNYSHQGNQRPTAVPGIPLVVEIPDLLIDDVDLMNPIEEAHKRELVVREFCHKLIDSNATSHITPIKSNVLDDFNGEIESLKLEISNLSNLKDNMLEAFKKQNQEFKIDIL